MRRTHARRPSWLREEVSQSGTERATAIVYVRVEHVHVNDGGQAIVGNVKTAGSGAAGSPEHSASGVIAPVDQDR